MNILVPRWALNELRISWRLPDLQWFSSPVDKSKTRLIVRSNWKRSRRSRLVGSSGCPWGGWTKCRSSMRPRRRRWAWSVSKRHASMRRWRRTTRRQTRILMSKRRPIWASMISPRALHKRILWTNLIFSIRPSRTSKPYTCSSRPSAIRSKVRTSRYSSHLTKDSPATAVQGHHNGPKYRHHQACYHSLTSDSIR